MLYKIRTEDRPNFVGFTNHLEIQWSRGLFTKIFSTSSRSVLSFSTWFLKKNKWVDGARGVTRRKKLRNVTLESVRQKYGTTKKEQTEKSLKRLYKGYRKERFVSEDTKGSKANHLTKSVLKHNLKDIFSLIPLKNLLKTKTKKHLP